MNFIRRVSGSSIISARRWLAVWLILGAAAWLLQGPGQRTEAARGLTLQGEAAIAQLKREGSYDSLAAAYRAAAGDPWSRVTKLAQPDFEKEDLFGAATAISGDTAVIGASNGDLELKADRGAAYVFVRYGAVWALQQKLWAPNGATYDEFGRAVAIGGDTLVIGAPGVRTLPAVSSVARPATSPARTCCPARAPKPAPLPVDVPPGVPITGPASPD